MPAFTQETVNIAGSPIPALKTRGYNHASLEAALDTAKRMAAIKPAGNMPSVTAAIAAAEAGLIEVGGKVNTDSYYENGNAGGNTLQLLDALTSQARPEEDLGEIFHVGSDGLYLKALFGAPFNGVFPSQFGLIADFDFSTHTGTDNTVQNRRLFNYAAKKGISIVLGPGERYMSDTISLTPLNNADYPAKAGRVKVEGPAMGLITGDDEPQGSGFAHINGSAARFIDIEGQYSIQSPGDSGGFVTFENVILIGGDSTTDILYFESCNSKLNLLNSALRIRNPAGNGLTEITTWLMNVQNVLIRGDADPTNTALNNVWTGIAHKIGSNTSGGQINMKVYNNLEIYKCGYGRTIGRGAVNSGTFGPLVFIGGQISNCQQHGEIVGGGTYSLVSIGVQFEGNRLNGIRCDSQGANDLPRGVRYISPYITNNGRIEDGSDDSFAVAVIDSVGFRMSDATFQNTGDGIYISPTDGAKNVKISNPLFRTVRAYGQASGTGIKINGGSQVDGRITIKDETFNQNFATNLDDATSTLSISKVGGRASYSGGETTINLKKSETEEPRTWVNFNNASPTSFTNFEGAPEGHELLVTFSNIQTTIVHGTSIYLRDQTNFTPANNKQYLVLRRIGGQWRQAE